MSDVAEGEHAGLLENDELQVDKEAFKFPAQAPGGQGVKQEPRSSWRGTGSWIVALLLAVLVTDLGGFFYVYRTFRNAYAESNAANLEPGNPYIGLDLLYRSGTINSSKIEPFINVPRVAAQVFRSRPQEPSPRGKHLAIDIYGTLTPNEKHLQVDSETNTILQFRIIDFGMEKCSLVMGLPSGEEELEGNAPFSFQDTSSLDIFRLDHPGPVNARQLTWGSRPKRQELLGAISPSGGQETVISWFPCKSGSLYTFEVACQEGSDCLVDVWTSQNKTWGMYLYQHQTI